MTGSLRLPARIGMFVVAALVLGTSASGRLAAQMATYRLDKDYTAINFSWSHLGLTRQSARVTAAEGRVNFDPANPEASAIEVTMKAANITSGIRDFDLLLKSPEYFNAAQFPLITFKSTAIRQLSDKTGQVMGDLTIKGITRPVALNVVWNYSGEHPLAKVNPNYLDVQVAGFSATAVLRRSDWDLSRAIPLVSDEVRLSIETELLRSE
ncbi:MAG TPA: YceI family protein [Steroidobacter sp.]|nr:YceI family protein [Steroidobacter sp.]HWV80089.1 YceI family protein [Hyphomicrobiaceae bacterium]